MRSLMSPMLVASRSGKKLHTWQSRQDCLYHGMHDLHVHLLAAAPNASRKPWVWLERFLEYPLQIEEGFATAPSRTGHGVCLDWDALEHHRG